MKKISLLFYFMVCSAYITYSQQNTNYGVGSGTLGSKNSFFGKNAGTGADAATSDNVAIGFYALDLTYTTSKVAEWNVAVGAFALRSGGEHCTAIGGAALSTNYQPVPPYKHGVSNTAVGSFALHRNYGGKDYNTAVGARALEYTNGDNNTAFGYSALSSNQNELESVGNGSNNAAFGSNSMLNNKNGSYNTASGGASLYSNTDGSLNTADGYQSLYSNTSGYRNTAVGYRTLYSNGSGYYNTAVGYTALNSNINGYWNTATGYEALYANNMGTHNTAGGFRALDSNTTGVGNTAEGGYALHNVTSGNFNSALGYNAGQTTSTHLENTTALGYLATPTASNQVRIGNTSVTSIGGYANWTNLSDGRFKKDVREDVSGLDFIVQLKPVSYTVDKEALNKFLHATDSSANQSERRSVPVRQTGFIAQDVEALIKKSGYVFSGVDVPENENDPYGLRYAEFVVPLVKGMQELTARLEAQEQKFAEQEQKIDSLVNLLGSKSEIEKGVRLNDQAVLLQNNPNPFNAETEIKMTIPDGVGFVTVMIYNLEGKQMKNIQVRDRGQVSVKISGSELSAGMYLYALIADGKVVDTKRMILTQ